MNIWIAILAILFISISISKLFNFRIEKTVPMACFILIIITYVCGLFGNLYIGFYLCLALSAASAAYCVYLAIITLPHFSKKTSGQRKAAADGSFWLRHIFTPGLVILCLFSVIFVYYLQIGRLEDRWDFFSHWGTVVKYMHHYNTFGDPTVSRLIGYAGYPPSIPIFQYLWQRIATTYNESMLFSSFNFLQFACMLPAFATMTWKKNKRDALCLFAVLLVVCRMFYDLFTKQWADPLLGLLFCYCFFTYCSAEEMDKRHVFELGLGLAVLTLAKETGFALAIVVLLFIVADTWIIRRKTCKDIWTCIKTPAVLVFSVLMTRLSWVLHLRFTCKNEAWPSMTTADLLTFITANLSEKNSGILRSYIMALFLRGISNSGTELWINFPAVIWMLIFIIMGLLMTRRTTNDEKKQRLELSLLILVLGWIMYAGGLMLQYMFTFIEQEGRDLAAYPRYMGTYILGMAVFITMMCLKEGIFPLLAKPLLSVRNMLKMTLFVVLSLYIIIYGRVLFYLDYNDIAIMNERREHYAHIERVVPIIADEGTEILYLTSVSDDRSQYSQMVLGYNAMPHKLSIHAPGSIHQDDLLNYDYIYLHEVDDSFWAAHGDVFAKTNAAPNGLYRAERMDGGVLFVKIMLE